MSLQNIIGKRALKHLPDNGDLGNEGVLFEDGYVLETEAGEGGFAQYVVREPTELTQLAAGALDGHKRRRKAKG